MKAKVHFAKMCIGGGNDYIYVNTLLSLIPQHYYKLALIPQHYYKLNFLIPEQQKVAQGFVMSKNSLCGGSCIESHTGIGSDGLVLIGEVNMPKADYSMSIVTSA